MVPREAFVILRRMEIAVMAGAFEKAIDLQKTLHIELKSTAGHIQRH